MNFLNLEVVDLDRDVIRQAARLRAEYRLRPPDALQISACLLGGAEAFVTNDHRIGQAREKLDVVILDEFISQKGN